jgi:hypothetical protein
LSSFVSRQKWQPPAKPEEPIPHLVCAHCGKDISELTSAISEFVLKDGIIEAPVYHFECALLRVKERERAEFEPGDVLSYMGGGRFGIIRFDKYGKHFSVKKIIKWEQSPERAPWRKLIAEYFSRT